MKLHLLSDLHLEFEDFAPPATDADVVVLAGDVQVKARGVAWAKKHFANKPVLYVLGNHEYYSGHLIRTLAKMKEAAAGSNVHVLDNEALVLDGVRFLACTLWTDYQLTGNQPLAQWDAQQGLADFQRIRDETFRKIRPYQLVAAHLRSRRFLEDKLAETFTGPTVVVTHHAPCELSIHERFRNVKGHLNASYASRLDSLMGGPALWVHGHTHDSFDYNVYGTRVVCNPRGYGNTKSTEDLNDEFDPGLVLTV